MWDHHSDLDADAETPMSIPCSVLELLELIEIDAAIRKKLELRQS